MKKTTPIVAIASGALVYLTFSFLEADFNSANWSEGLRFLGAMLFWLVVVGCASANEASK